MNSSLLLKRYILIVFIFYVIICFFPKGYYAEEDPVKGTENYVIIVEVDEKQLYVIRKDSQEVVKIYPVATGAKETPSPLGTWVIVDKGRKKQKYFGTRWMGLNVPWGGYGIHGTNRPDSIGQPLSNGCIRMHNKHVEELYKYIPEGTVVIIRKGDYGAFGSSFRVIKPGDYGSDVYEVQRLMEAKGYFLGPVDGVYRSFMRENVLEFREEKDLQLIYEIDYEFYKALGIELMD